MTKSNCLLTTIKRDFVCGMSLMLIIIGAICIYTFGSMNIPKCGIEILFLCLVGVGIAELLKFGFTGKHLSCSELFQNILFSGILATTSSLKPLLHAPISWQELLMISNVTATCVFLIYHISNAFSLANNGKHLRFISGLLIVGTPYLIGLLLLLSSPDFCQLFCKGIFIENIIRFSIIFCFNEAIVNGISYVTKKHR